MNPFNIGKKKVEIIQADDPYKLESDINEFIRSRVVYQVSYAINNCGGVGYTFQAMILYEED